MESFGGDADADRLQAILRGEAELGRLSEELLRCHNDIPASDSVALAQRFLRAAAASVGMSSGAVVVVSGGFYLGPVMTSFSESPKPSRLQFRFGEGPAMDALRQKVIVQVDDFAEATDRWPAVAPAAVAAGSRSVINIPLVATEALGLVLTLHSEKPLPPCPERAPRVENIAALAPKALLDTGAINTASLRRHIETVLGEEAEIHQASGILASVHSTVPSVGLDLLRLTAWAEDRHLADLARETIQNSPGSHPER